MNIKTTYITHGAAIAAAYVVLTLISGALGLSGGPIQFRLSEALTILPVFTPSAVPGLFIGCILANMLTGAMPLDVITGSMATLIGAALTRRYRSKPFLAPVFPILSNSLIIPFVLQYVYKFDGGYAYFLLTVLLGEAVCCGLLGGMLLKAIDKRKVLFSSEKKVDNREKK